MVTQADIAEQLGVSRAAVSLVLSGKAENGHRVAAELRTRIEVLARNLGYQPNVAAQQLKGKPSHVIGVIANDWFHTVQGRFLGWLNQAADERGYKLLTAQMRDRPEAMAAFVADFASRGTDGLLYLAVGGYRQWPGVADTLATAPVRNMVCVMGRPPVPGLRYVDCDLADGAMQSVAHLLGRGRRRVVLILGDLDAPENRARHAGFVAAHAVAGRPPPDAGQLILAPDAIGDGPWDVFDACGRLVDRVLADGRVDAVLAPDDQAATQLCRHLRRRGARVPDDVAVVGHDNDTASALFDPPLTTVSYRVRDLAAAALDLLAGVPRPDADADGGVLVRPALFVREST
ncbi:MAG: degA [Phycisphaerales bacterium]|nr:degA [Phycisphaerales bacterium]